MKKWFCGALILGLALFTFSVAPAMAADDLMAQADQAWLERAQVEKTRQAADLYRQALKADPKNEAAAWKLSRTLYRLGQHVPEDKKLAIFEEGVEAAKKAVAINPKSVDGHYWLGVNYGLYGNTKGIMKSLSLVDPIKEEMAKVIELNPDYDQGGPYRVLGRLYFKLPGLFGGDNDKAIELLSKAVSLGPQRWLNHVYLAAVYMDEGQNDKAKALLDKVIAGPAQKGMEPEYTDWKAQAQELRKKIK